MVCGKWMAMGAGLMVGTTVWAQAPAAAPAAPVSPWNSSVAAGATVTRGNSKTMVLNGSAVSAYKAGQNECRLGVEANYGETELTATNGTKRTDTNVNNARAFAEYRRLLDERNYVYGNAEAMKDDIADIDYRVMIGPGVGRYFLKSDTRTLSAETGVAYIMTRIGGKDDDTVALRVAERFEQKVTATSKIWESAEYLPAFEGFGQYLVNAEAGIEAAVNARFSLRVVAQDKYNSKPAPGKKCNDAVLIAGLSYRL